jgi:hypothetical protein
MLLFESQGYRSLMQKWETAEEDIDPGRNSCMSVSRNSYRLPSFLSLLVVAVEIVCTTRHIVHIELFCFGLNPY